MRVLPVCLTLLLSSSPVAAQDAIGVAAPKEVVDSGLLEHILPRFSLKSSIRIKSLPEGPVVIAPEPPGEPVFSGEGTIYYLRIQNDPGQHRFLEWMTSTVGQNTISRYERDGVSPFRAHAAKSGPLDTPSPDGNAIRGAELSLNLCGRCHVVGPRNRMNGLGSTPSFSVLRGLPDWIVRFEEFFVRNPHGAFTQITDVTAPFPPDRPSPIVPIELTLDDLDAIIAHVASTAAADLGAPLQHQ